MRSYSSTVWVMDLVFSNFWCSCHNWYVPFFIRGTPEIKWEQKFIVGVHLFLDNIVFCEHKIGLIIEQEYGKDFSVLLNEGVLY